MLNKTLPLAMCLGLSISGASFSSDSNNDFPARTTAAMTVADLQAKNDVLQQQLAQMQAMMSTIATQATQQQEQIQILAAQPQNPDPKVVEKAVVREIFKIAHIPADDLSDDEGDHPTVNYNFNYVRDNCALLSRLQKVASQLDTWHDNSELMKKISALEEVLGIAAARHEKEKKELLEQRRRDEELRVQMEVLLNRRAEEMDVLEADLREARAAQSIAAARHEKEKKELLEQMRGDEERLLRIGYLFDQSLQEVESLKKDLRDARATQVKFRPAVQYN
ncbi:MAG: hypothetical protein KBB83_08185 [Alphaproteobacteria bacterium]|nr:hypothetical protein [Alphaproteobacteria bacterium]